MSDVTKQLEEDYATAKLDYELRGMQNTYGLKISDQLRQKLDYDQSFCRMLHAEKKLKETIKYLANNEKQEWLK